MHWSHDVHIGIGILSRKGLEVGCLGSWLLGGMIGISIIGYGEVALMQDVL